MSKTLYQKVFDAHVVREVAGETPLIYICLLYTSPSPRDS